MPINSDDCISREQAICVIKELYIKCDTENMQDYRDLLLEAFDVLPHTDSVPVRCKDCKHRSLENNVWACPFGLPGGPEFFCSYGMDGKDGEHHES